MIKKILILFFILASFILVSTNYAKPEKGKIFIPTYLRRTPKKTTPLKANVIKVLKKNEICHILKFYRGWYFVSDPSDTEGWVYHRLLKELDENNNEIANYDPYEDKSWKKQKNKSQKPATETTAQETKNKTDKKNSEVTKKDTKPSQVDNNQTSKPGKTQDKPSEEKKKIVIGEEHQSIDTTKEQDTVAENLTTQTTDINADIDKINQKQETLDSLVEKNQQQITLLQKKAEELEKDTLQSPINAKKSGSLIFWILLIILIIIIFIVFSKTNKNSERIDSLENSLDTTKKSIISKVDENFKKINYISRTDYNTLLNYLIFLENSSKSVITDSTKDIELAKGDVDKIKPSILSHFKIANFVNSLQQMFHVYIDLESTETKIEKMAKLSNKLPEIKDELSKNENVLKNISKDTKNWFKNFNSLIPSLKTFEKNIINKIKKNKFDILLQDLKKDFPQETSNLGIYLNNSKWDQAKQYLEKIKVEISES